MAPSSLFTRNQAAYIAGKASKVSTVATIRPPMMAALLSVCVAMAISAVYELIEWGVALAAGSGATDFLGTQGDVWDTQSDMFWALMGAMVAVTLLRGWHDRQIKQLRY